MTTIFIFFSAVKYTIPYTNNIYVNQFKEIRNNTSKEYIKIPTTYYYYLIQFYSDNLQMR